MAYKAKDFLKAIPGSGGIINEIARRVGCRWITAKRAIERMPTVQEAWLEEKERMLDLAESRLLKSIRDGDISDVKWYLSRMGAERGYAPKAEVTQDGTIEIVIRREEG